MELAFRSNKTNSNNCVTGNAHTVHNLNIKFYFIHYSPVKFVDTKKSAMKKFFLFAFALLSSILSFAQQGYKKLPSFGVHFTMDDFQTAADLKANGLSDVLKANEFYKLSRMALGLGLSYTKGISDHLDYDIMLHGTFVNYDVPNVVNIDGREQLLLQAAATAHLKLLSDKHCVVPYISAGIGAQSYRKSFSAFIPLGLGLQFKIVPDIFIVLNTQYRVKVTEKAVNHLFHSIGFNAPLVRRPEPVVVVPPPPATVVLDRDGDGILDAADKCPDIPGIAALEGCPDRDGDGLADAADKCPDVPGIAKYQGCPIPDTDGDGINDEQDKCVNEKGYARYQGCPIPDTDADGVNDEEDKCKNTPGLIENKGCPEMVFYYKRADATLTAEDKAELDKLVEWMGRHPELSISIEGHTSTLGDSAYNQKLSEKRAQNSVKYLVSKGIDPNRLKAVGYGEQFPIGDNAKEEGRAKSRRVVMRIAD